MAGNGGHSAERSEEWERSGIARRGRGGSGAEREERGWEWDGERSGARNHGGAKVGDVFWGNGRRMGERSERRERRVGFLGWKKVTLVRAPGFGPGEAGKLSGLEGARGAVPEEDANEGGKEEEEGRGIIFSKREGMFDIER